MTLVEVHSKSYRQEDDAYSAPPTTKNYLYRQKPVSLGVPFCEVDQSPFGPILVEFPFDGVTAPKINRETVITLETWSKSCWRPSVVTSWIRSGQLIVTFGSASFPRTGDKPRFTQAHRGHVSKYADPRPYEPDFRVLPQQTI